MPEPVAVLAYPGSPAPVGHPEFRCGVDGKEVLPVTCKYSGYVAYHVEHLKNVLP